MEIKKITSKILITLMSCLFVLGCFGGPVEAASNDQVVWTSVFDYQNNTTVSQVLNLKEGSLDKVVGRKGREVNPNIIGDQDTVLDTDNRHKFGAVEYATAWPGIKGSLKATGKEEAYAKNVMNLLSTNFNTALSQIIREQKLDLRGEDLMHLSSAIATCAVDGADCEFEGVVFNFTGVTKEELDEHHLIPDNSFYAGVTKDDFRKFITKDQREFFFMVSYPKGYANGQYLSESLIAREDYSVSWKDLVLNARLNYSKGITANNMNELEESNEVFDLILWMFGGIVNGISSALGLAEIEELMFNRGLRDVIYYKGLVNYTWFDAANTLYWVLEVIAIFIIVIGIVVNFIKRNMSIMNPMARASLKDSFLKLFYVIILLLSFNLVFYGLVEFNYLIVKMLSSLTSGDTQLMSSYGHGFAGLLISFVLLYFKIFLNVTYLIRGITIIIMYATAPLFIVMLMYGDKGKQLFTTWVKEIVVNIFMQTFHAFILVIYLVVLTRATTTGTIERIVLAFSFLPLTKLFKDTFLGTSITDKAAQDTTKTAVMGAGLVGAMTGLAVSSLGGAAMSKIHKGIDNNAQDKGKNASIKGDNTSTNVASANVSSKDVAAAADDKKGISPEIKHAAVEGLSALGAGAMWLGAELSDLGSTAVGAPTQNFRAAQIKAGATGHQHLKEAGEYWNQKNNQKYAAYKKGYLYENTYTEDSLKRMNIAELEVRATDEGDMLFAKSTSSDEFAPLEGFKVTNFNYDAEKHAYTFDSTTEKPLEYDNKKKNEQKRDNGKKGGGR